MNLKEITENISIIESQFQKDKVFLGNYLEKERNANLKILKS